MFSLILLVRASLAIAWPTYFNLIALLKLFTALHKVADFTIEPGAGTNLQSHRRC
jgi:hypothetical protein